MEINDFAEKVCTAVRKKLGREYKVDVEEVRKNSGVILHGLLISTRGRNIVPKIYLESFLEAFQLGTPFDEIVCRLLYIYQRDTPQDIVDMEFFRHYEEVKDRICYYLIGRKENEELLEEIPHIEFLDLAICFYYACRMDGLGDGSILIHHSHLEMWGIGTEDLYCVAQANTPRLCPWECAILKDILNEISELDGDGEPLILEPSAPDEVPIRVLGNSGKFRGAACILYPGVLEGIAAEEKHNLYILPSSIHEVLILPDTGKISPDELKKMVFEVNRTQVAPEEVLSDSLYYYDSARKEVVLA